MVRGPRGDHTFGGNRSRKSNGEGKAASSRRPVPAGLARDNRSEYVVIMAKRRAIRQSGRHSGEFIAAAEFKATCLELMERVREAGAEYVVTKHGRPVAKLVPYEGPGKKPLFGALKGSVVKVERPYDPLDDDWDVDDPR